MNRFWKRISNRDKLAYTMVVAFGICLLGLILFFQFGYQLGERKFSPILAQEQMIDTSKMLLINEPNPVVRKIEIAIALGLIVLGIERLKNYKKERLTK